MSDPTVQNKVFFSQGGSKLTVASGGTLELDSGSTLLANGAITGGLVSGTIWHVDSVDGSDSNDGLTWATAFATLGQAVASASANEGDVILLAPSHAETVSGAAWLTISTAGLTIFGTGNGHSRPTFTWTATASQIILSGAGALISNCVFDFTGIDAVVAGFSVTAADVAFQDCEFVTNGATAGCVKGILTAATATRFRLSRCRFLGAKTNSGTTTTAQVDHEVGENFLFEDCHFEGKCTQNILNAAAIIAGLIKRCTFHTFTGTKSISVHASTQALIADCRFVVASGTAPIVGTIVNVAGNVYTTEGIGVVAGSAVTF